MADVTITVPLIRSDARAPRPGETEDILAAVGRAATNGANDALTSLGVSLNFGCRWCAERLPSLDDYREHALTAHLAEVEQLKREAT